MKYYFATSEDAPDIVRMMDEEAYPGDISLAFSRTDDPVSSLKAENDGAITLIARDDEGSPIAMCGAIPRYMYIGGELKLVGYVTGMRRKKSYKKIINWKKIFSELDSTGDYDAYICCIYSDNDYMLKMMSKKRSKMPYSLPVAKISEFFFSPRVRVKDPHPELEFANVTEKDLDQVISFLREQGKRHDLFPKLDSIRDIKGLKPEDLYCLKRDGKVVAATALWDRSDVKQFCLKECRGKMKILRAFNPLLSLLGYVTIPPDDTVIKFAYVAFMESENDDTSLMISLFARIKETARGSYDLLCLSATDAGPKYRAFKKIRGITMSQHIVQLVLKGINDKPAANINGDNMDLECALL